MDNLVNDRILPNCIVDIKLNPQQITCSCGSRDRPILLTTGDWPGEASPPRALPRWSKFGS